LGVGRNSPGCDNASPLLPVFFPQIFNNIIFVEKLVHDPNYSITLSFIYCVFQDRTTVKMISFITDHGWLYYFNNFQIKISINRQMGTFCL